jgi:hypothetical protein
VSSSSQNPAGPRAREELRNVIRAQAIDDEGAEQKLNAYRAAVLAEAIAAARGEYLTDATGDETDEAYNRGVSDAIAAIGALTEGGAR